MLNNKEISDRPLLFDRIQVNVTPNYTELFEDIKNKKLKLEFENYSKILIEKRKENNLKFVYSKDKNTNYFIYLPIPKDYEFISDLKIQAYAPFSVSFKLNFIRLLRQTILQDPEKYEFNQKYDKKIFLDDDNYINRENWTKWDNNLVSKLQNDIQKICIKIANTSMQKLMLINDIIYENVTVTEIETNKDFFVGKNLSLIVIKNLPEFIFSKDGIEFRNKLGIIALNHYAPMDNFKKVLTTFDKTESNSIQLQISKGLYFKIYRKDKDHIRTELTFKKDYLKRKFKDKYIYDFNEKYSKTINSRNIKRIIKPILEFSKDFLKDADLINILRKIKYLKDDKTSLNRVEKTLDFLDMVDPKLSNIVNHIITNSSIEDEKLLSYIKRKPKMRILFEKDLSEKGKWIYHYNPKGALDKKNILIKNRYAKPKPYNVIITDKEIETKIQRKKHLQHRKRIIKTDKKLISLLKEVPLKNIPNGYSLLENIDNRYNETRK